METLGQRDDGGAITGGFELARKTQVRLEPPI
jgi:hypothetical protein